NLSLVTFLAFGTARILFPGDLGREGWRLLMTRDDFRRVLARTNVFVASHHGRESGFECDVFKICHPEIIVISDKPIEYETQRMNYGEHATGIVFGDGRIRRAVSTRD